MQKQRAIEEENFRLKKIQEEKKEAERLKGERLEKKKQMIRDVNTVQDYYKAWDKYNPDEDIKQL